MKAKITFMTMAISLMAIVGKAQSYMVTPEHVIESKVFNMEMRNIMELRDGSILANVQIFAMPEIDYGNVLYKIEYDSVSATITDSVFIEDPDMNFFLMERNPFDNDNIYAKIVRNIDSCSSDLLIRFFDDNLNFKPEKEIRVPIADTIITPLSDNYILDNSGDIVLFYEIDEREEQHIAKIGVDGTIKIDKILPSFEYPINTHVNIGLFNETPQEYCLWGLCEPAPINPEDPYDTIQRVDTMRFVVLDSQLDLDRVINHNSPPEHYEFSYGWDSFLALDDTTFLFSTKCDSLLCHYIAPDTCYCYPQDYVYYDGLCLSKCGKSDAKNHVARIKGFSYSVYPMEVKKSGDGSIYTAFYSGGVTMAKLTPNLETIWESKCSGGSQYFVKMVALENGGVAVGGLNVYYNDDFSAYTLGIFFVIFKDDTFSIAENKASRQKYAIYPNPATGMVHISADMAISRVEVRNLLGAKVLETTNPQGNNIDVSSLAAGVYTVHVIKMGEKQGVVKLIKS